MTDCTAPEKRKPGQPRKNDPHSHASNWPETEAQRQTFLEWAPKIKTVAEEHGLTSVAVDAFDAYGQIGLCAFYKGKRHAVKLPTDTLHIGAALAEKLKTEVDEQIVSVEKISPNELDAIHREAWDAFELDRPTGRTDSLGRIWDFDIEIKGGVKTVDISVRRVGGLKHGSQVQVPAIDYQDARPVVEQIVNRLNGELA